jgi:serine O-acetyltransferase
MLTEETRNRRRSSMVQNHVEQVVNRVAESIMGERRICRFSMTYLPHRDTVHQIMEQLMWLLFPGYYGPREVEPEDLRGHVHRVLGAVGQNLFEEISGALRYADLYGSSAVQFPDRCDECDARAEQIVGDLLTRLPAIRTMLSLDVQAAFDGDPAARHTDETILCYPGLRALAIHRLAHELYKFDVPLVPRMISEWAHAQTGIDIHPGARIGRSFFIDHGTGVVIGETTVIGDHCKVYQGVTLGAKSFPKDESGRLRRGVKRHPTLEDHVTVYAGATILGGDTIIGAGSVINGGVFITSSVPPGHVVRGPSFETTLRSNPEMPPGMYAI